MIRGREFRLTMMILILTVFIPFLVSAQVIPHIVPEKCRASAATTCGLCDIAQLVQNVINAGIYIAIFLSAVLFAYAGWQYITAGGQEGKASEAKKIFWNVGVGLVLVLGAWLIVDLIMKILVNQGSGSGLFGPWNEVC